MKNLFKIMLFTISVSSYGQTVTDNDFTKMNCGLYNNKAGEIAFKSSCLKDDNGNHTICYATWGYLMDEGDTVNSEIVELKNIVDTNTFIILNEFYCKDRKYVYAIFYTSGGATFNITKNVDVKTFTPIGQSSYGLDKQHVYFRTQLVKSSDLKTFKVFDEYGAYDKYNYYYYGEIITRDEAQQMNYIKVLK